MALLLSLRKYAVFFFYGWVLFTVYLRSDYYLQGNIYNSDRQIYHYLISWLSVSYNRGDYRGCILNF